MIKNIQDLKVLIVEDENINTEILEKILLNEGVSKIQTAPYAEKAIDLIEKDFPDIILLDLKIPYSSGGSEDSINSFNIIMEVDRINRVHEHQIRIIVISGTTSERGLQKLVARDKSLIQHMFDKGMMGKNPEEFSRELIAQLVKAINYPLKKAKPSVTLNEMHEKSIFPLKNIDSFLYEYIKTNILSSFEMMEEATESNLSFAIVVKCGIVVEYLVDGFSLRITSETKKKLTSLSDLAELKKQPKESEISIKDKLTGLTGRRFNNGSFITIGNETITRQAADMAQTAYRIRNDASHTGEADPKNKNIFSNAIFNRNHALTSISLIMPIVQDYITFKSK